MTPWNILSVFFCVIGAFFFLAGTAGMLRFPDPLSRLHALTKSDNLGLGFIVLGLSLRSMLIPVVIKLILIWLTAMVAGSTACYLVGHYVLKDKGQADTDQAEDA